MRPIMSNICNLIENFIDIINTKCCLIMGAKYYNSSMNEVCTIYPANIVSCPQKLYSQLLLFKKENNFCMAFVSAISWLTWVSAHEVHLKYNI